MDILGNIAYEIAKNLTSIGHESEIKDLITKDLSLLYFDTLTKSYQFANRSFYEFFLARYLTGVENGNKEITKLRDFWLTRNNSEQKNIIGYYIEILSGKDDKHDILVELMTSWLGFKSELFTKRGNFLSEGKNIEQKIGVCSDTNVLIEKLHGLPLTTLFSIILGDESQGKYEWEDSFFLNLEVLDKIQQKTNISQINHYYQMYSKSILEWDIDTVMHFRNLILKFSKITDKNSTPINNIIQKPWGVVNRGQNRILRFLSSIGSELSIKKTVEILDALAIDHRDYDVRNTYIELLENNSDSLLLIESPLRGLHTLIRKGCFYHALDAYLRFIDTGLKPYIIEVIEGAILFKKYGRVDEADSIYRKIVKLGVANFTNEAMRILAPIDDGNFLPDKH